MTTQSATGTCPQEQTVWIGLRRSAVRLFRAYAPGAALVATVTVVLLAIGFVRQGTQQGPDPEGYLFERPCGLSVPVQEQVCRTGSGEQVFLTPDPDRALKACSTMGPLCAAGAATPARREVS